MAAVCQRPPPWQCRAPMPVPGQGAAQPRALMASRQKVSSAGVASLDRCYHGLPQKLPAGAQAAARARASASRIARICPWICSQFPPAGARWPPPLHAGRSRRFLTARAIPLTAGSKNCEGSLVAANAPARNGATCRMACCEGGMGSPLAAGPWEWPPNIAAPLCSKQHAIRCAHDGRGRRAP